ncbi:MAG: metallophosphoesterase [Planctomycetota bacterium]
MFAQAAELLWGLFVLLCHGGTMLSAYNRLNALGFPRRWLKRIGKLMFLWTVLMPPIALAILGPERLTPTGNVPLHQWLFSHSSGPPIGVAIYIVSVVVIGVTQLVPWLLYRPIFGYRRAASKRQIRVLHRSDLSNRPLARTRKCRILAKVPGNQMFDLAIESIELPIAGLPDHLDGYRLAQFSDVHFTGHVDPEMTRRVVELARQWEPSAMVCTGDIIDHADCLPWIETAFGKAAAPDGCYYILGNHDKRISDPEETRERLNALGWIDAGGRCVAANLGGVPSWIIGNEAPWFGRPAAVPQDERFRLLLSHSPDQIAWARKWNCPLMLAGHTHGGQGRLPLLGPLLSPSKYGSRFAGGDFDFPPTTMHVNRGLSGTHLLRLRCRPELSLLTLRHAKA